MLGTLEALTPGTGVSLADLPLLSAQEKLSGDWISGYEVEILTGKKRGTFENAAKQGRLNARKFPRTLGGVNYIWYFNKTEVLSLGRKKKVSTPGKKRVSERKDQRSLEDLLRTKEALRLKFEIEKAKFEAANFDLDTQIQAHSDYQEEPAPLVTEEPQKTPLEETRGEIEQEENLTEMNPITDLYSNLWDEEAKDFWEEKIEFLPNSEPKTIRAFFYSYLKEGSNKVCFQYLDRFKELGKLDQLVDILKRHGFFFPYPEIK
jgi:hypothetical protein